MLEGMADGADRTQLILLEYHTQGKLSTPETRDLASAYSISQDWTPSLVLNGQTGENRMIGPQDYEIYKARIESLTGRTSPVAMTAKVTSTGFMNASVELTNLDAAPIFGSKLYAVVYDEKINTDEGHYIVTDITPVVDVSLAAGQTAKFELKSVITNSTVRHMVIILKAADGRILQALFAK